MLTFLPPNQQMVQGIPINRISRLESQVSSLQATSGFQAATSGAVNGVNQTFVFARTPNVIAVDQTRIMQKVSSDSTINWTGTTTVVLTVAPNSDVFAIA